MTDQPIFWSDNESPHMQVAIKMAADLQVLLARDGVGATAHCSCVRSHDGEGSLL